MKNLTLTIIITLAAFAGAFGQGIAPTSRTPGSPAGSYSLGEFETVNLFNGNLNFKLPLLGVKGRGEVGQQLGLVLDNQWNVETTLDGNNEPVHQYNPTTQRTLAIVGELRGTGYITAQSQEGNCAGDQGFGYWHDRQEALVYVEADGTEHMLVDPAYHGRVHRTCGSPTINYGRVFESTNGQFMTFYSDSDITSVSNDLTGYLMFKNGIKLRIEVGRILYGTDRNGNRITYTYEGSPYYRPIKVTDSTGREVEIAYDVSESSPYGLCDKITFKGTGGATRTIRFSKDTLHNILRTTQTSDPTSVKTIGQLFSGDPEQISNTASEYNPDQFIKAVWLPDGRSYQFKYSVYGRVARVVLPTGGAIEYDYATPGYGSTLGQGYVVQRASAKRIYDETGTLQGKTAFSLGDPCDGFPSGNCGTSAIVEQFDPSNTRLTKTKHYFRGIPNGEFPYSIKWDQGKEFKSESFAANGTTVLAMTATEWAQRIPSWCTNNPYINNICGTNPATTMPQNNSFVLETYSQLVDANLMSKVSSINPANNEWMVDSFNNPTDVWYYDYGTGTPGSFLKRVHTDYVTDSNYTSHTGAHLRSLVSQTWVSSDSAGNNKVALSQIEYDNYSASSPHAALVSRSSVTGFDSTNYGTSHAYRGNPTAVTAYANAAAQTGAVTSYSQYDMLGNVLKTIDANGNAATISYSDNFGSPDNNATTNSTPSQISGYNTFAYPSSSTNPMNWTAYVQYDYFTGQPVNAQDINGAVSKTIYSDALDRPTQSVSAVGTSLESQTTIAYDDTNRTITTTSDLNTLNDNLLKSISLYDGLGRTIEQRSYEADGDYRAIQTQYDALSRPYKQSNRFRPTEVNSNNPILWTTGSFDSLGRATSITTPDSAVVQTSYSGNSTTVIDQAGKVRRSITNAIGQLIRVDEPNASNQLDVSGSQYQPTSYTYDVLNNLLTVTQASNTTTQCGGASSCSQTRTFAYNSLSRLTSATNPESGTISYVYDSVGNLTQKDDPRGVRTTFAYDALNRLTSRSYSTPSGTPSNYQASPTATYTYDGTNISNWKGRLTKVATSVSTTEYTGFDILGRVTSHKQITDGTEYTTGYVYNLSGALLEETYPSGRVVKNEIDASGDLSQVSSKENSSAIFKTYVNDFTYNAAGAVSSLKLGNGRFESTQFNNRLQPIQVALGASVGNAGLLKIDYTYSSSGNNDNNGNLLSQTITVPGLSHPFVQTYIYDELNRLKSATETNNSTQTWKQTFTFDRYGNRRFDEANTTMPASFSNQALTNPSISATNNRLSSSGWTYDSAGNTTGDPNSRTFHYDGENKQTEVKNSSNATIGQYAYDGDGRRVKKYVPSTGETTIFVYSFLGRQIAEYSTIVATANDAKVAYLTSDHLGSPRINTDAIGAEIARHDYHPFGEEVSTSQRTMGLGYTSDAIRKKFTGFERDSETGSDFAHARTYTSQIGRFTSADPLVRISKERPQNHNKYVYAINSPYRFVDPDGKWPTEIHNLLFSLSYPGLDKHKLQRLQDGSYSKDVPTTVLGYYANDHGMCKPSQSMPECRLGVVGSYAEDWKKIQGDHLTQHWYFGRASHTIQDLFSPAHSLRVYDDKNFLACVLSGFSNVVACALYYKEQADHSEEESVIPQKTFDDLIKWQRDAYRRMFGDAAAKEAFGIFENATFIFSGPIDGKSLPTTVKIDNLGVVTVYSDGREEYKGPLKRK